MKIFCINGKHHWEMNPIEYYYMAYTNEHDPDGGWVAIKFECEKCGYIIEIVMPKGYEDLFVDNKKI